VLREAGLVEVRQEAQRRVYSLRLEPLAEVDEWLGQYRALRRSAASAGSAGWLLVARRYRLW
jgi:DNA-binding transcriptional ArsR family regulator